MNLTNQYAPGAPMEEPRMEGNALVTTKIARVDNEAIIPARTCNDLLDFHQFLNSSHDFDQYLHHHLVVRWKELTKENPLKRTSARSCNIVMIFFLVNNNDKKYNDNDSNN